MKTVKIKIFKFEELNDKAKEVAIQNRLDREYENGDILTWLVDDCYLFEPEHKEILNLYGNDQILIKNNKESVYFDLDRRYWCLHIEKAIEVTDEKLFLKWLGVDIDKEGLENTYYDIYTPSHRRCNSTTIKFEGYNKEHENVIQLAIEKFNNHINTILNRLEDGYKVCTSEEYIAETLIEDDLYYTANGEVYEV